MITVNNKVVKVHISEVVTLISFYCEISCQKSVCVCMCVCVGDIKYWKVRAYWKRIVDKLICAS